MLILPLGALLTAAAETTAIDVGSLPKDAHRLNLTEKELRWLKEHPVVRFTGDPARMPLEAFTNNKDHTGIVSDYLQLLEKHTGLTFKIIPHNTWSDSLFAIQSGEADIISAPVSDQWRGFLNFSIPHLNMPLVIITRKDFPIVTKPSQFENQVVAVPKAYAYAHEMQSRFVGARFINVETVKEGMEKVAAGEVEALIVTQVTADYAASDPRMDNLKISGSQDITKTTTRLAFGVRKDWPELVSILNKAIADIPLEKHFEIKLKWSSLTTNLKSQIILTQEEKDWLAEKHTVRVRVDHLPPFMINEPDLGGMAVEYVNVMRDMFGIDFQLLKAKEPWIEGFKDVKGQHALYDLMPTGKRTEQRVKELAMTDHYLHSPWVVFSRIDIEDISHIDDLNGRKVVVEQGYVMQGLLEKEYPGIELTTRLTTLKALEALASGEADAYVGNLYVPTHIIQTQGLHNVRVVASTPFGYHSQAMLTRKEWAPLASILDKGLKSLTQKQHDEIQQKWTPFSLSETGRQRLVLTPSEKKWLKERHEIRVAARPSWAPVESVEENGEYEGISMEYLEYLTNKLDVDFTITRDLSWSQAIKAVANKEADMLTSVTHTPEREQFAQFTRPYINMPIRIFARDDLSYIGGLENLREKQIAVVDGSALQGWITRDFPNLDLKLVGTTAEGLSMVSEKRADAFVGNVVTTTYYLGKLGIQNLRASGDTPYTNNQSMAVRNDWPEFASILQKALDTISPREHDLIFSRWMSIRFEQPTNYTLAWQIFGGGLTLLLAILYWNRRLANEIQQRKTAQTALRNHQLMLEKRVDERTQELRASEALTKDILTGTNAGTWDWTIPNNQVIINERWAEIIGHTLASFGTTGSSKITADDWKKSLHPSDLKDIWPVLEKNLIGELDYYDVEFRQRHKDGHWVWVNARGKVVEWDKDGSALRMSGTHLDISAHKHAEEQLIYQAHFDSLTELPNRFLTLDRLNRLIIKAKHNDEQVGLLFLDLDDFKRINDTLGHDVGDAILVEAAKRLQSIVGEHRTIGRLGGDEFVVLMGDLQMVTDIHWIAEAILYGFREAFTVNERKMVLTTSIGISIYPNDGQNVSELLKNADSAMYHSKQNGRNMFSFFTDAMNHEVSRRLLLEEQMRNALERKEFTLYYQPKIRIKDQRIIGAEALLRWHNAELGEVEPDEFIPVAEQNGMIVPIGHFVLDEAIRTLRHWFNTFGCWFSIAVNLSPRQFRDPGLVGFVEHTFKKHQVAKEFLEFEITEGVLMTGHSYIDASLHKLSDMGATLAMDDFGTGYSSLNYLRNYPFNVLKIDRSFIDDLKSEHDSKKSAELINAVIAMSHSLGLEVVAEGVETQTQLSILRDLGCDIAQGFLLGHPVPMTKLEQALKESRSKIPRAS